VLTRPLRRPSTRKSIVYAALTAGILGVFAVWSRPPSLLDRASKVADVRSWGLTTLSWRNGRPMGAVNTYGWISDREAIVFLNTALPTVTWMTDDLATISGDPPTGEPIAYDIVSRKYRRLDALSNLFKKTKGTTNRSASISPDGKRIKWKSLWNGRDASDHHVASLDGANFGSRAMDDPPEWTGDSQLYQTIWDHESDKWIGLRMMKTKKVYKASRLSKTQRVVGEKAHWVDCPSLNGPGGVEDLPAVDHVTLNTCGLENGSALESTVFRLPHRSIVAAAHFSNDAGKILWVFFDNDPSPMRNWLGRFAPVLFGKANRVTTSVWISRNNRSHMHEIGEITDEGPYPALEPSQIRWLPGGNSISFVYREALWTVPVK
jgi:hypothetical protein